MLCFFSSRARAESVQDYEGRSDEWTGLSELVSLSESLGFEILLSPNLDFAALDNSDVLFFIYPQKEIEVVEVSRFVIDGGRVIIADDFGKSTQFLERLEIKRETPSNTFLPHNTFYLENKALPVFRPRGKHPLLTNVKSIVANYPSMIVNLGGPVVSYDEGPGFVYDMNLGMGKVVVIADGSIFINQMLGLRDNKIFAENALRYACESALETTQKCRIRVLTKSIEQTGHYRPQRDENSLEHFVFAFNQAIEEVPKNVNRDFLFFFSLLVVIGLIAYLVSLLPFVKTRNYSKYITDFSDTLPWPQSEFDWNISRFSETENLQSDVLPMAILKELFEEIFLKELGLWPSQSKDRPNISGMTREFSTRFLGGYSERSRAVVEKRLLELLSVFTKTPPRDRVFLENESEILKGDLEKYHGIAVEIITIMGHLDDYEQRKWGSS